MTEGRLLRYPRSSPRGESLTPDPPKHRQWPAGFALEVLPPTRHLSSDEHITGLPSHEYYSDGPRCCRCLQRESWGGKGRVLFKQRPVQQREWESTGLAGCKTERHACLYYLPSLSRWGILPRDPGLLLRAFIFAGNGTSRAATFGVCGRFGSQVCVSGGRPSVTMTNSCGEE